MRSAAAATLVALLAGAAFGQATRPGGSQPAAGARKDAADDEKTLTAGSLRHSAIELTCVPAATRARAGRLLALSRLADRLAPGDWRTNRLLADIYYAQARPDVEARALEAYLAAFPADHVRRLRWIAIRLDGMQSAEARAGLLQGLADRDDLAPALRAEAAAMLANLRHGQGQNAEAVKAARHAIQLDPCGPRGLAVWSTLEGQTTVTGRVAARFRLLRGDPRASREAWELALDLGALGLYKQASRFLEHARAADRVKPRPEALPEVLQVQYCNALLDAKQHDQAIEVLEAAVSRYPKSADLKSLLIEAYRATDKAKKAEKLVQSMASSYKEREAGGAVSEAFAAEVAWFYVDTDPRPSRAIIHAQRAVKGDPNNPVHQRILGAAELAFGRVIEGERRLEKLVGTDGYASVFLAERYDAAKNVDDCKKTLLAGAAAPRSGPAFRRLAALAAKHSVVLPPAEGASDILRLAEEFDDNYLQMLLKPERFIAVELKFPEAGIVCGEPVEVLATLKNIGPVDVPLGERGLLRPEMALRASLAQLSGQSIGNYVRLPMAVWPAGRYLRPGEQLQCTVRLDVAGLGAALAHRPLEDVALLVGGVLDPLPSGVTALPSMTVEPGRIVRAGLLAPFDRNNVDAWNQAYRLALGRIVRDLRRGDVPRRMRAARQTGALLAMASDMETGGTRPPAPLAGLIRKPVMLSIARALLRDRSPAVRQELVASLAHAELDKLTIAVLGLVIDDPSPVVRCRVVDLLAGAETRGHETLLRLYASDRDEIVAEMAKAFRKP